MIPLIENLKSWESSLNNSSIITLYSGYRLHSGNSIHTSGKWYNEKNRYDSVLLDMTYNEINILSISFADIIQLFQVIYIKLN